MDNTLSFVLVSLINTFAVMTSMTNMLLYSLRKINQIFIYSYILLCHLFLAQPLGQYTNFLIVGGVLLIICASNKHYIPNCTLALFGYLFLVIINYVLICFLNLFGITVADIYSNNLYLLLFVTVYAATTHFLTALAGKHLRIFVEKHKVLFSKRIQRLFSFEIVLCAIIFELNIIHGESVGYPSSIIYFNTILFAAFFIITLVIFFFCLKILQKNHELMSLQQEKQSLEEYMKKLEDLYQDMRIFKHDYINILATLQCYIAMDQPEPLREYFNEKILPTSEILTGNDEIIGKLGNIKLLELKGILYSKLIVAMNQKLHITLEISEEISSISMEMLDLCTVIGAFMDNAIEAAKGSTAERLLVVIIKNSESTTIMISNSSTDLNVTLDRIYDKDVSTKDGHSGLGLYSAYHVLDKYTNIIHTTNFENNIFTQTLEICST